MALFIKVLISSVILIELLLVVGCSKQAHAAASSAKSGNYTTPIQLNADIITLTPKQNALWFSPNRTFAFGFIPLSSNNNSAGPSNSSASYVSLCLFYYGLPQQHSTVVWTPNSGGLLTQNATLTLSASQGLVLTDSAKNGSSNIVAITQWNTNVSSSATVSSLQITDSGNIILSSSVNDTLWQSWDYPTDTLLPGQQLPNNQYLVDSQGRYQLLMQDQSDGNLVIYYMGAVYDANYVKGNPYWDSQTYGKNISALMYSSTDGSLSLYNNGSVLATVLTSDQLSSSSSPSLERVVLSNTGVLVRYVLASDNKSWSPADSVPSEVCKVLGICGPYGICQSSGTTGNYSCSCPDGFHFLNASDWFSGCRPQNPYDCSVGTTFLRLPGVQYAISTSSNTYEYHYVNGEKSTETSCLQKCISTCYCAAATYVESDSGQSFGNCYLSTLGQVNTGNTLSSTAVTYLKTSLTGDTTIMVASNGDANSDSCQQRRTSNSTIAKAATVGFATAIASVLVTSMMVFWYISRHCQNQTDDIEEAPLLEMAAPVHFSYKELRAASNGFIHILGKGGFGPVYKGVLAGGTNVAIKKLEGSSFGEKQFRAEVMTIGSLHHVNLVRLLGFCAQGKQTRMLVYDLAPKGSLDKYLFKNHVGNEGNVLEWGTRFKIILGTARAIKYLHEECHPCIVHCDIKPENILLDDEFNAKVSDFGMAQLVGGDANTGSITRVRGTIGYMAPEWMSSKHITTKVDIYSFGVVVLEVLSGRRALEINLPSNVATSQVDLVSWAYSHIVERNDDVSLLLDPRLMVLIVSGSLQAISHELQKCVQIALWCTNKEPLSRPSMGDVVHALEGLAPIPPLSSVLSISED